MRNPAIYSSVMVRISAATGNNMYRLLNFSYQSHDCTQEKENPIHTPESGNQQNAYMFSLISFEPCELHYMSIYMHIPSIPPTFWKLYSRHSDTCSALLIASEDPKRKSRSFFSFFCALFRVVLKVPQCSANFLRCVIVSTMSVPDLKSMIIHGDNTSMMTPSQSTEARILKDFLWQHGTPNY